MFPPRKAYLFDTYERIFSADRLILAFQNNNLSHSHMQKIKLALTDIKPPPGWEGPKPKVTMTFVRSGILGAVVKKRQSKLRSLSSVCALSRGLVRVGAGL